MAVFVFENFICKVFSLPSAFYKMFFHSTNVLYVRLLYHSTADYD